MESQKVESIDVPEKSDKRLNNAVAISVVIFSVFTAFTKIKDDNIVQAMQAAKADAVDTWSEYQSTRIKQHLAENNVVLISARLARNENVAAPVMEKLQQDIAKYESRSKDLAAKAKSFEAQYDALNFHDDQFDLSDAFMAVSISVAAVAALVELWWLLMVGWGAGAMGIVMGLAGFLGWPIHPGWLVQLFS